MTDYNPYEAPAVAVTLAAPDSAPPDAVAERIGGWLYLLAVGMVISPFTGLRDLSRFLGVVMKEGTWARLTSVDSDVYHPMWGPLLVAEGMYNVLSLAAWAYMNYLFFNKKKALPTWYIRVIIGTLIYEIADALGTWVVRPDLPLLDYETGKEIAHMGFAVCVWVPYMRVSKRVARTFVRP